MTYNHVKALHIIFVVSWFAGLFYLPRLLAYHAECQEKDEVERRILSTEYTRMERLLMRAIMFPAMVLTYIFGLWLLHLVPQYLEQGWLQLKLGFVVLLTCYHFYSLKLMNEMAMGKFRFSGFQLRLYNEVATIILFAIVFLVVLKNSVDWLWGLAGLLIFAGLIMGAVKFAKKKREAQR